MLFLDHTFRYNDKKVFVNVRRTYSLSKRKIVQIDKLKSSMPKFFSKIKYIKSNLDPEETNRLSVAAIWRALKEPLLLIFP